MAVAAALDCPDCEVHAVEFVPEALELIERNRLKFRRHNLNVHSGRALALLSGLPRPTHVFVGGSGGELRELLRRLPPLADGARVRAVVSAVTLETQAEALAGLTGPGYRDFEAVQLAVSASRVLGRSHALVGRNPVTVMSAWAGESGEGETPSCTLSSRLGG